MVRSKITILISTLNGGINNLHKTVETVNSDICYLVIHQITDSQYKKIPDYLERMDIKVYQMKGKGLSKSRNKGIEMCTTDYAIIADDDIEYITNAFKFIIEKFEKNKKLDVATFKIQTLENESEYKNYPKDSYALKEHKHWFSSVEIAIKVNSIKNNKIKFDERFGLGSIIPRGEEQIFIEDCIAKNLSCYYFPNYILKHPFESSGKKSIRDYKKDFYNGALLERRKLNPFRLMWNFNFKRLKKNCTILLGALYIKLSIYE